MSTSELNALKKTRSTLKGSITRMLTFVRDIDAQDTKETIDGFKMRLSRLNDWFDKFNDIESQIFQIDAGEASLLAEVEENYFTIVNELNSWIRKRNVSDGFANIGNESLLNASQGHSAEIKLPKINIPYFSGDYMEWQSFYDLFITTIHSKEYLTGCQKFQYLKGLLRGEAETLLRHYNVTEANYKEALQKLVQRYDRKRHTINAFIKTFIDQNNVTIANASSIRKLWDTSDEVVRGLKALGPNAENRDPWLIYILVHKLDADTRSLWAQETVEKDFPTLNDLFDFLAKRTDALESVKQCTKKGAQGQGQAQSSKTFVITQTLSCPICKCNDHKLFDCKNFKAMNIEKRRELIKTEKRCFNCLNFSHNVYSCKSKARCFRCQRKHHTLLHTEEPSQMSSNTTHVPPATSNVALVSTEDAKTFQLSSKTSAVILPTTMIKIKDNHGDFRIFRALLDSSSQESFVTEECAQSLGLRRSNGRLMMKGLGETTLGWSRGKLQLTLKSVDHCAKNEMTVIAYIVPKIANIGSRISVQPADLYELHHLALADPNFCKEGVIDILLGTEVYYSVTTGNRINLRNGLVAEDTSFGWVLAGRCLESESLVTSSCFSIIMDVDESLRKFWEIESIPFTNKLTEEEQRCEDWFRRTTTRSHDGRFIVKLPFKEQNVDLGSSRQAAITRLCAMERRFKRDSKFHELYMDFMMEYERLHHMKEIPANPTSYQYYLPHHGVLKESSSTTKLRVVFDASAKSNNKTSLNSNLLVGPVVQSSLFDIILRFRKHKFVLTGDVEKMYRQIWVAEPDTEVQKIVWRADDMQPIKHFQLQTLTYGTGPASFIATRCLKELAILNKLNHPAASEAIEDDMYVDDLMTGADSEEKLISLRKNVFSILQQAQFNLRKISSNILEISDTENQNVKQLSENPEASKILGLIWNPLTDNFSFQIKLEDKHIHTKRTILSEASKIFDPIGWLAPVIIRVKILFQNLWREPFDWDDHLSTKIEEEWLSYRRDLSNLGKIEIPRWIGTIDSIELHGFCDASTMAYAAAIYARVVSASGYRAQLITSKTKVSPIKQISVPRLELMGAFTLAKLMNHVKEALKIKVEMVVMWTDSKIVLDWLSSHPRRWPTFVGNRTSAILESYSREQWRHVKSEENPADCASRGISVQELQEHTLWWSGPKWLQKDIKFWPEQLDSYGTNEEEKASKVEVFTVSTTAVCEPNILETVLSKFSSFNKMKRVLATVMKYCNFFKNQLINQKCLTAEDVLKAAEHLIRYTQTQYFTDEIKCLINSTNISRKSKILSLNPFLDDVGILRVGGRIEKSSLSYSTKHPIILPRNSALTTAILLDFHENLYHAGINLMVTMIRHQYWVIRAKDVIRKTVKNCVKCTRQNPIMCQQAMGDLPRPRLELNYTFQSVGVDYAGPFKVQIVRKRGQIPVKAYICIFVCLSTKAVHIEYVSNLSTDNFLGALSRFVDRRGLCCDIFSDNGTNFVGANRQLTDLYKFLRLNTNHISYSLLRKNINWHFNPPGSPSMGGLWEAAVKATKQHLYRVVGECILTTEEFSTLLTGIEAILNSRPLYVSNTGDEEVLTPAHFLIGRPMVALPEKVVEEISPSNRWDIVKKLKQHFWHRFQNDYLTKLNTRNKWKNKSENLKVNDMVLIKDECLPAAKWSMGKIVGVNPGEDGLVRVVQIKTSSGVTSRHISKLCKLPVDCVESDDSKGGE